ncbi:MAG: AMIN domain-containing protein, partial [Terriglobales bacterium]
MRITALSFVILVAGLAAVPARTQDSADFTSRSANPAITSIAVAEGVDGVEVEVEFNQLVQPEVRRLEHPDRLVFDFPGCELAGPGHRFEVKSGLVVAVSSLSVGGVSPGARVVIDLGSGHGRERTSGGNKLVVNLSSVGNKLIIGLGTNGGDRHSSPANGGNEPATSSPAAVAAERADNGASKPVPPMPSVPAVGLGTERRLPKTAEVVEPMPSVPAVGLGTERRLPKTAEVVEPMPSVPAVGLGTERRLPKTAEVVEPMPSVPAVGLGTERR